MGKLTAWATQATGQINIVIATEKTLEFQDKAGRYWRVKAINNTPMSMECGYEIPLLGKARGDDVLQLYLDDPDTFEALVKKIKEEG